MIAGCSTAVLSIAFAVIPSRPAAGPSPFESSPADRAQARAYARDADAGIIDSGTPRKFGMLAFEADDHRGRALSDAIGRVLRLRGHDVEAKPSFTELRDKLGCGDYEMDCLGRSPRKLRVDAVVYGSVRRAEGGHQVEVLLVGTADEPLHVSLTVPDGDLEHARLYGTARNIVAMLWPRAGEVARPLPPPPKALSRTIPTPAAPAEKPAERVGLLRRLPVWSRAGLGSSLGVSAVGTAMFAGTFIKNRELRGSVAAAAVDSRNDMNPANDISGQGPMCAEANEPSSAGGGPRNARVADLCAAGVRNMRLNAAALGLMVVGYVGRIGFGVATIVHGRQQRRRPGARAKLRVEPSLGGTTIRF